MPCRLPTLLSKTGQRRSARQPSPLPAQPQIISYGPVPMGPALVLLRSSMPHTQIFSTHAIRNIYFLVFHRSKYSGPSKPHHTPRPMSSQSQIILFPGQLRPALVPLSPSMPHTPFCVSKSAQVSKIFKFHTFPASLS